MFDNDEDNSRVPGMYENKDGSWNEKLELEALKNQRTKYIAQVLKVLVSGMRLFCKDEDSKIRGKALNLLEKIYNDIRISQKLKGTE